MGILMQGIQAEELAKLNASSARKIKLARFSDYKKLAKPIEELYSQLDDEYAAKGKTRWVLFACKDEEFGYPVYTLKGRSKDMVEQDLTALLLRGANMMFSSSSMNDVRGKFEAQIESLYGLFVDVMKVGGGEVYTVRYEIYDSDDPEDAEYVVREASGGEYDSAQDITSARMSAIYAMYENEIEPDLIECVDNLQEAVFDKEMEKEAKAAEREHLADMRAAERKRTGRKYSTKRRKKPGKMAQFFLLAAFVLFYLTFCTNDDTSGDTVDNPQKVIYAPIATMAAGPPQSRGYPKASTSWRKVQKKSAPIVAKKRRRGNSLTVRY